LSVYTALRKIVRMRYANSLLAGVFVGLAFGSAAAQAGASYGVTDLGTLGGSYSSARAINANGLVTGISSDASGNQQAFVYALGHMQALSDQGASQAGGNGVNASGEVAVFDQQPTSGRALRYENGRLRSLGDLGGGVAMPYAINAHGNVVGSARTADGHDEPFLYAGKTMTDLGTLGGHDLGQWNAAFGVNAHRAVTGTSWAADGRYYAFLWKDGSMQNLGTLGGSWSEGSAINDYGQITGLAYLPGDGEAHAFLWRNNRIKDLGVLPNSGFSWGFAINNQGIVVGMCELYTDGADHAMIVQGGPMRDLNSLIDAGSGWQLNVAYGINDDGQIVGEGTIAGQTHAFLLTPN
jgi:probable HAF family extracellular repeat protein